MVAGAPPATPVPEPPPELRFRRRISLSSFGRELWRSRELIRTLVERDLRARYRQAVLGFMWSILPSLGLMLVLTVFVQRVGDVFTEGVPYEIYAFVALVPWQFFSSAMATGSQSLITNLALLNKVYCPREVFPLASVVVAAFDAVVALSVLVVLFPLTGTTPKLTTFWVVPLVAVLVAFTVGLTLLTSAVVIYLRDLRHALPVLLQFGLFATPVAYSLDAVPSSLRPLYSAVNPLAPVIDGLRASVLLGRSPRLGLLGIGALTSLVVLGVGIVAFKRLETGIADVG